MKLNIPIISQQGNNTANDCGPACVAMLAGVTIEKVMQAVAHTPGEMMPLAKIMRALGAYRLHHEHSTALSPTLLRESLARGWPVIALVGYGRLPHELKAVEGYNGNHYVVITGWYAGGFYVHDPLWPSDLGAWREWPESDLVAALAGAAAYSVNQGVIVRSEREILSPTAEEFGRVVSDTLDNIVLLDYLSDIYRTLNIVAGDINARQRLALAEIVRLKQK